MQKNRITDKQTDRQIDRQTDRKEHNHDDSLQVDKIK